MKTKINLTVERIKEMDDWEVSDLSDRFVKNRLSRFAIDPETQSLLDQRDMRREDRSEEYEEVFADVKRQMHDILYSPEIIQRHLLALESMERNVEAQLKQHSSNDDWRPGAQGFLNLVKDEIARVESVMEEMAEDSASTYLDEILAAIEEHESADDADAADALLYDKAKRIRDAIYI